MSPRSVQASLLRKSLSACSDMYTICFVVIGGFPLQYLVSLRMAAPRIGIRVPVAAFIFSCTGMRVPLVRPIWLGLPGNSGSLCGDCCVALFVEAEA